MLRRLAWCSLAWGFCLMGLSFAQSDVTWDWGWGGFNRVPPKFPEPGERADPRFTFCRILYQSVRREYLGHGWNTDYPDSDYNFMTRFSELTTAGISREKDGKPNHVVVRLTDPELFDYPFIFMEDVGTAGFSQDEVLGLREYLLRGGFLYVDDFWGDAAWDQWTAQIARVLPPSEYPIEAIPLTDPIFDMFYRVSEFPQIPSIQFWRRSGRQSTSERGSESDVPHFRGIRDAKGRLLVVMSHNTDIADGWEREGEDEEFFYRFSVKAYPVGVNIVLYAMSH